MNDFLRLAKIKTAEQPVSIGGDDESPSEPDGTGSVRAAHHPHLLKLRLSEGDRLVRLQEPLREGAVLADQRR